MNDMVFGTDCQLSIEFHFYLEYLYFMNQFFSEIFVLLC